MKRSTKFAGILAAAAVAPILPAGNAGADDSTLYFSAGSMNCAIFGDGSIGCDLGSPLRLSYTVGTAYLPLSIPINEILIDQSWLPAHPTFDGGTPYTLAGGNPSIYDLKTGQDMWGPVVEHAGSSCRIGFHGSFTCNAKGRGFSAYSGIISAAIP